MPGNGGWNGLRRAAALLAVLALGACGGGGGGGNSISVAPTSLTFTAPPSGPRPPTQRVVASYHGAGVVVGYAQGVNVPNWLNITTDPATADNPATFDFTIVDTSYADGQVLTTSVRFVTGNADGSDLAYVDVPVTYNVVGPTLVVTPASLDFELDGGSQDAGLTQTLQISDSNNGAAPAHAATWSVQSVSVPWLKLSPSSGKSAPPATLTASIDTTKLQGVQNGAQQSASFTLQYLTAASQAFTVNVPVTLTVNAPTVRSAAPYYAYTSAPSEIVLRGSHFDGLTAAQVHLGTATAQSLRTVDSQRLAATFASAPAGTQHIHIDNVLNQDLSQASVTVVAPAAYAAEGPAIQTEPGAMLLDPLRNILFVTDIDGHGVAPYRYASGAWQALPQIANEGTLRARMSPDGNSLLLLDAQALHASLLDPAPGPLSTVLTMDQTEPGGFAEECGILFFDFGVLDNGTGFVTAYMTKCEPTSYQAAFPALGLGPAPGQPQYGATTDAYSPYVLQPAESNGLYFTVGDFGQFADYRAAHYDPDNAETPATGAQSAMLNGRYAAISASGDRVALMPDTSTVALFDAQFNQLGLLKVPSQQLVAISPDGTKAYWPDSAHNQIHVIDLTAQISNLIYFPEATPLTWSADPAEVQTFTPTDLMITPDGQQLFVYGVDSGSKGNRILVAKLK